MGKLLQQMFCVGLLWLVSTVWATAHELEPAVLDIATVDGEVRITLDLVLEAKVAGLDLDGVFSTDEVEGAERYDELRALEPDAFGPIAEEQAATLERALTVLAGDAAVPLELTGMDIPAAGNVELLRISRVTFVGALPPGADSLRVAWAEGGGFLVVRQQGVDDPFTQTLSGGERTEAFAIPVKPARPVWVFVALAAIALAAAAALWSRKGSSS